MQFPFFKSLLMLPPVVVAVMIVSWMNAQPRAQAENAEELAVPVRVVTLAPQPLISSASGFGRVEATRTWSGVAEVDGRLTIYDNALQIGALVQEGDQLFEIDPRDYEIAVSQAQADVLRAQASLEEINVNAANTTDSIAVEREILSILEADKARIEALVQRGSVATTELETANRALLTQQSVVTSLNATLALVTPDTLSAEAALAQANADLESAERNLSRTQIGAPFSGRVTDRNASAQQYVRAGEVLVSIEGVASSEIEAEFQPTDLSQLIGSLNAGQLSISPSFDINATGVASIFGRTLTAEVVAQFGNGATFRWPASITRVTGRVDETTGAVGIVVQVDGAGQGDPTTLRPPLANGSFVEVVLSAPQSEAIILVPEAALRFEGPTAYVYVVDSEDRLTRQDVTLAATYGNLVQVDERLEAGMRVVLSDPRPATLGLLLQPVERRQ